VEGGGAHAVPGRGLRQVLGSRCLHLDLRPSLRRRDINDSGCTYALGYILRRRSPRGGRWHIVYAVLDSAQPCSDVRARVPEPVVRDFGLEGIPHGDGGTFGPC
jgi:hypothetical protein